MSLLLTEYRVASHLHKLPYFLGNDYSSLLFTITTTDRGLSGKKKIPLPCEVIQNPFLASVISCVYFGK